MNIKNLYDFVPVASDSGRLPVAKLFVAEKYFRTLPWSLLLTLFNFNQSMDK